MMDPIVQEFIELLAGIELARAVAAVRLERHRQVDRRRTGDEPRGTWATHLRRAVRFGDGIRFLLENGSWHFVEVGPGRTLASLVKQAGAESKTRWC